MAGRIPSPAASIVGTPKAAPPATAASRQPAPAEVFEHTLGRARSGKIRKATGAVPAGRKEPAGRKPSSRSEKTEPATGAAKAGKAKEAAPAPPVEMEVEDTASETVAGEAEGLGVAEPGKTARSGGAKVRKAGAKRVEDGAAREESDDCGAAESSEVLGAALDEVMSEAEMPTGAADGEVESGGEPDEREEVNVSGRLPEGHSMAELVIGPGLPTGQDELATNAGAGQEEAEDATKPVGGAAPGDRPGMATAGEATSSAERGETAAGERSEKAELAGQGAREGAPVELLEGAGRSMPASGQAGEAATAERPARTAERAFVEENHPSIIRAVRTEMGRGGGAMRIRLDPPELGAMLVRIELRDGAMSATFQTSNDEATRLLSHSLGRLKQTLEGAGISVEKLQVHQATAEAMGRGAQEESGGQGFSNESMAQEQQRREMLRRLWRRAAGEDEVDLLA